MRLAIVIIYLAIMIYFIFNGQGAVYIPMAVIAAVFIFSLPVYKKHVIQTTRKKIIEAQKMKQEGKEVKPFIEINSSPWYVLMELPGITSQMAKTAVALRKENGPYPSIDVFIQITKVKHVYIEHIKTVAYVKHEIPPIKR